MAIGVFLLVAVACIYAIWWRAVPDNAATKMREMGLSLIGCVAFNVIMIGFVWGLSYFIAVVLLHESLPL
jgi:hypothetical protein